MPAAGEIKSKFIVLLVITACVGLAILLGVLIFELPWNKPAQLSKERSSDLVEGFDTNMTPDEKAAFLLERFPVIDGHNDLPWNLRKLAHNDLQTVNFSTNDIITKEPWASYNESHTDIPRLRKGHVGAQFWVAYSDCKSQGKDSVAQTLEQIDVIHRLIELYPNDFQFCSTADCIENTIRHSRKIAGLIGIEGGHSIQSSPAILRQMYRLGVRYLTLTHTCNTPWADASPVDNPKNPLKSINNGLSEFGLELIDEMNRIGMMVDLSHVSEATMRKALSRSKAPVIFSHSSSKTICDVHRNVEDDVLKLLERNGGIIMINFYSAFIQCDTTKNATLDDVVNHFEYIKSLIGPNHIGIGGDFDGVDSVPEGLEDTSKYPNLFAALIEKGWTLDDLKQISYGNIMRVFKKVEEVSSQLKNEKPMHAIITKDELGNKNFSTSDCLTDKSLAELIN